MINGKYHKEIATKNGLVIVDACEMYEGKFEIMAMYKVRDSLRRLDNPE